MSVNNAGKLLRSSVYKSHIVKLALNNNSTSIHQPTTHLNIKQLLDTDTNRSTPVQIDTIKPSHTLSCNSNCNVPAVSMSFDTILNNNNEYVLPVIKSEHLSAYKQSLTNTHTKQNDVAPLIEPARYHDSLAHTRNFNDHELNCEVDRVKRKHRSALKSQQSWQRYNYIDKFQQYKQLTYASMPKLCATPNDIENTSTISITHTVQRIHTDELTVDQFVTQYEQSKTPLIISGCADTWPAMSKWSWSYFGSSELRELKFKCGEDDEGYSVKMKLKHFVEYALCTRDDSPLYVFDQHSMEHDILANKLLSEYAVPPYFQPDLFDVVDDDRRPPHRWVLLGPERSGSSVHIDPLMTSAWNTLISGRKQWVLFKPSANKSIVSGKTYKLPGEDNEAITYFINILPRIKQHEQQRILNGVSAELDIREFIQYPGDTVYIPGGWHHAVLNLEHSIAVTQNFCSKTNFPEVFRKTRTTRKHLARRWQGILLETYVDMGELSLKINAGDEFDANFYIDDEKCKQKKLAKKLAKKQTKQSRQSHDSDDTINTCINNMSIKKSKTSTQGNIDTTSSDDTR